MEGRRGFRDRPAPLLQPPDPGDQVDAAAWCVFFVEEEEEEKEEEDETARLRGPDSAALPDGGKRVLVAVLLCGEGLRSLPLPATVRACVLIAVVPFCALQCGELIVDSGSGMSQAGSADFFISRSVPFYCRLGP